MATFHFDLVSPEKLLFSGEVEQVDVPGAEGDFGVLAGHAPMVTTLRPGILTVKSSGGEQKIVVLGGFAEVSAEGLTVLADTADSVEDIDRAMIATRIGEIESRIAKTEPGSALDKLITQLDHYKTVDRHLTGTAMH
jgi:F-type H+-transporting ATPase subunit epsilon